MPVGWQAQISAACRDSGSSLHLDGSRLWNAAVAQDCAMSDLVTGCETVSISLNKAIGAPVGSVLAGSHAFIEEAIRWRDAMGGEWRPVGSIAAAALAALDGWRDRLTIDAAVTRALGDAIAERMGENVVLPFQTNLIFLNRPSGDAARFVEILNGRGVKAMMMVPGLVRLAVHSGVREGDIDFVASALAAANSELNVVQPA
jgi:threonine aldolase